MDSRQKILTLEQAIERASELRSHAVLFKVVSGYFDILQAELVRRLIAFAEPDCKLFAIVSDPEHPITASAARLELAASLRVIDYVLYCQTGAEDLVQQLRPAEWIREEAAHLAGTERLVQYILERHRPVIAAKESAH